jgi:hypothetical protein
MYTDIKRKKTKKQGVCGKTTIRNDDIYPHIISQFYQGDIKNIEITKIRKIR